MRKLLDKLFYPTMSVLTLIVIYWDIKTETYMMFHFPIIFLVLGICVLATGFQLWDWLT